MESTSHSVPTLWSYSENYGTWSYNASSYIHMCPLATLLAETRNVVENTMELESQISVVPYFTNFAMETCWMDSENIPPMGSLSPIAHSPQSHIPVHYPREDQLVVNQNCLTTGENLDGISPKNLPKTQLLKQRRNQKKSKPVKKEEAETSQEVQQIVQSILLPSESESEIDPETKRKMKRAERERSRYHSMTKEARQAMRKRRYEARKQRQAEKN